MGRLFGTDGVRGVANKKLTCELALKIGRATSLILKKINPRPTVVIGKDTRISSDMLENSLAAGFCSSGVDVIILGVVPTPAVAYLVGKYKADAGVMISASHNPFEYNGIKVFNSKGFKLSDLLEEEIEAIVLDDAETIEFPTGSELGHIKYMKKAVQDYITHVASTVSERFDGIKVAIDASNGSASATAYELFWSLGAECFMLSDEPDGSNINDGCGSTDTTRLSKYVVENDLDLGIAFDGDADRCMCVDSEGNLVDGDNLVAIFAVDMKKNQKLRKNTAVVTVMSNFGFFAFAKENDISTFASKVGDRYVLEEMLKSGYNLGGEQSGHIIFLDHATTGDGQLTGVQLLSVIKRTGKNLKELRKVMSSYPQTTLNIKANDEAKALLFLDYEVNKIVNEVSEYLGDGGRALVRPSGTEPVIRVMVEGKDQEEIQKLAQKIADVIDERLINK